MRRWATGGSITVAAAGVAYLLVGRSRQLGWGATELERRAPLAGDDLITRPDLTATRAITIHCFAEHVWPWLAQLGQGRGGLYSYDRLENLVGCRMHSADRIIPEFQSVGVGDEVRLAPDVALTVAAVETGRALVLRGGIPVGPAGPPYDFTWSFVLGEAPEGATRLIVRERYAYTRPWAPFLVEPTEMISALMSRKMMRGIRDRAESGAPQPAGSTDDRHPRSNGPRPAGSSRSLR